jgi:hypothetical protein
MDSSDSGNRGSDEPLDHVVMFTFTGPLWRSTGLRSLDPLALPRTHDEGDAEITDEEEDDSHVSRRSAYSG